MSTVQQDVDRGLRIVRAQKRLRAQLEAICERLEDAALTGEQVPLEDKDREGRQFLARGTRDIVPVIIEADQIVGQFPARGEQHKRIAAVAAKLLREFYKPPRAWELRIEDGVKFRRRARELLGDQAAAFITACLARDKNGVPKSRVVVAWKEARPRPRPEPTR